MANIYYDNENRWRSLHDTTYEQHYDGEPMTIATRKRASRDSSSSSSSSVPNHQKEQDGAIIISLKSNGISPSSFHTKMRRKMTKQMTHVEELSSSTLTTSQKQLHEILHLAARNEVIQRRHAVSSILKLQREIYHESTKFKLFPLQNLAMEYYEDMMKEYYSIPPDPVLAQHSKNNRLNIGHHHQHHFEAHEIGDMNSLKEQYRAMFQKEISMIKNPIPQHTFLPELWSMEPRIFALETSSLGRRKYVVTNLGRFLQHYWRETDPRSRHYYELIPEGKPCRLYFDLEYIKSCNPHISSQESEVLMTEFINELCYEVQLVYDITIHRSSIVDLDSSTNEKFSRHLIVHLPNGELFANSYSVGIFVKRFVGRLAEEVSTGMLNTRHATLAKCLFVQNHHHHHDSATRDAVDSQDKGGNNDEQTTALQQRTKKNSTTCFVDLGVYTRNRLFRLMGSTKWGKCSSAALRISETNTFCFPTGFSNRKFYLPHADEISKDYSSKDICTTNGKSREEDHREFCAALDWGMHARALSMTLVVPPNAGIITFPILPVPDHDTVNGIGYTVKATTLPSANRDKLLTLRTSNGSSPIESLDSFFLELSQRGGIQGKIRTWSHEGSYFFFHMAGNRWCEHIGRAHKSNNIIWNVDLMMKTYWQTCHDPDCRAVNFRGVSKPLPESLASLIDDYLLEQELAELDEDKVVSDAMNSSARGTRLLGK